MYVKLKKTFTLKKIMRIELLSFLGINQAVFENCQTSKAGSSSTFLASTCATHLYAETWPKFNQCKISH